MAEERCETCRYWERIREMNAGWCHRYPPQVYPDTSGTADDISTSTEAAFPYVGKDEWCGEHKEDRVNESEAELRGKADFAMKVIADLRFDRTSQPVVPWGYQDDIRALLDPTGQLKGCPWCKKAKVKVYAMGIAEWCVYCLWARCRCTGPVRKTEKSAIKAWNARVEGEREWERKP